MKRLELTGKRFGRLTVTGMNNFSTIQRKETRWECLCDCGEFVLASGWMLNNGKVTSCGCIRLKKDLTGTTAGFWNVISYAGKERWNCKCRCGTEKTVSSSSLKTQKSISCGCFKSPKDEETFVRQKKEKILNTVTVQENGCWHWNSYKNDRGYGTTNFMGKQGQRINRVVWQLWKGKIPEGIFVLHHCDNPKCCNPDHLWLGTHDDNMRDMAQKGRAVSGERCPLHTKNRHKYDKHNNKCPSNNGFLISTC